MKDRDIKNLQESYRLVNEIVDIQREPSHTKRIEIEQHIDALCKRIREEFESTDDPLSILMESIQETFDFAEVSLAFKPADYDFKNKPEDQVSIAKGLVDFAKTLEVAVTKYFGSETDSTHDNNNRL